ncbi:uncharacterized protein LOC125036330 [Penaeus chinensis]|uniref:uncharacterized protein LOC125036330 n=1 Tax=Penaeus chinensis TaxID=139456 RepID=UPI001FB73A83|nr:uncharacterized protein LOC125036330 [Penaeus chinensis]
MSFWWNGQLDVETGRAKYTCYPGYFAAWNENRTKQELECQGILGGWRDVDTDAPAIFDCYAMEVCNDLPLAPSPLIVNYTNENTSFVNGTVSYVCPDRLATGNKSVLVQTLTCVQGSEIKFEPEAVEPCNICVGDPNVTSSYVIDYDSNTSYVINTTLTAMCWDGHMVDAFNDSQAVVCTPDGWSDTLPCLPSCTEDPPDAGDNMARSEIFNRTFGSEVFYNCTDGYFIPETFPNVTDLWSLTCEDYNWTAVYPELRCDLLCLDEPPLPPGPGNTTWDFFNRTAGYEVRPLKDSSCAH